MKTSIRAIGACLVALLMGCSHVHTISMPISKEQAHPQAPVDLSPFWKANGFTLMDPSTETGKLHYSSEGGSRVIAVWEKWFKGFLFKYAGGIWATERVGNGRYSISVLPVSTGQDADASKMAAELMEYLNKHHPGLRVELESRGFVDFR